MTPAKPAMMTAAEFALLADPPDGSRQELRRGEIIVSPPPGYRHGVVQGNVYSELRSYVKPRRLGRVTVESGTVVEEDPDTVLGPDVAYWSAAHISIDDLPVSYPDIVPDLVAEIVSPSTRPGELAEKTAEYLAAGVREVWIVDPESRTVRVHRPGVGVVELGEGDVLTCPNVLPGFSCRVAVFFE